jgi:hypothetical protein
MKTARIEKIEEALERYSCFYKQDHAGKGELQRK